MGDLPAPFVPADVDIRGMSGFMLDTDRLLASELVALGTPEECWAALMLWCRAWQQHPPGSLPNDERILAAFSKAGTRWKKVKDMALRGFVLCSDGRLYHRVLTEQVMTAWTKRKAYRNDQERLRDWREKKRRNVDGNGNEMRTKPPDETAKETPLKRVSTTVSSGVSEPDRQGQGQGQIEDSVLRTAPQSDAGADPPTIRETLWRDGIPIIRSLIGLSDSRARSFLGGLLKAADDDCARVFNVLSEARDLRPADPSAWITAACAVKTAGRRHRRADPLELEDALMRGGKPADPFRGTTITVNPDDWRRSP